MREDLIKRSDAIEQLNEAISICPPCMKGTGIYRTSALEEAIDIINQIPSADRPQGWIPCSERLPDDPNPNSTYANKMYQVTTDYGKVFALEWCKTEVRGKMVMRWEWQFGNIYHGTVVAWKPLSEPWEGADDE